MTSRSPHDPTAYHQQVQQELALWEARGPSLLTRLGTKLFLPAQKAAEALIPISLHKELVQAVDEATRHLITVTEWFAADHSIARERLRLLEQGASPLLVGDHLARKRWGLNMALAAAEGGLTGATGLAGLLLDVPALHAISLKTVFEIGRCYALGPDDGSDHSYGLQVLLAGAENDTPSRFAWIAELKKVEHALLFQARMSSVWGPVERTAFGVAHGMTSSILRRKALQFLPVVGGLVGAAVNAALLNDVAEVAYMTFRRRALQLCLAPSPDDAAPSS